MTRSRAVLDFIGLPPGAPGNLECRFQKGTYRDDGTWIDDSSRPLDRHAFQRERHRVVIEPGQSIRGAVLRHVGRPLAALGYEPPSTHMIRHIAKHAWSPAVLAAYRDRLDVTRPELRLAVRALGFDIEGRGELAIGLGKATVRPDGVTLTQKSGILLRPGDPIDLILEFADMVADRLDYQRLADEDRELVRYAADKLWTPERLERRAAWSLSNAQNGGKTPQIEFVERVNTMAAFTDIPQERAAA